MKITCIGILYLVVWRRRGAHVTLPGGGGGGARGGGRRDGLRGERPHHAHTIIRHAHGYSISALVRQHRLTVTENNRVSEGV